MLIANQLIEVRWHNKNREHFTNLGYEFTKMKDSFLVNVNELNVGSNALVEYMCDYCGEIFDIQYNTYVRKLRDSTIKKDCCMKCAKLKFKETNLFLYGVENPNQREEIKEKTKRTNMEKYGVEYVTQVEEFKDKAKITNLERYGETHPQKNNEVREKRFKTNQKRYGGNSPMSDINVKNKLINTLEEKYGGIGRGSEIISKKIDDTNLERYGTKTVLTLPEVKEKALKNISKKKQKISKQQLYIHNLVGGELNYQIGYYMLDIAFPEDKIYIEYDGGGHNLTVKLGKMTQEEFDIKEEERFFNLYKMGWRCLRIISENDKLPNENELLEIINNSIEDLKNNKFMMAKKKFLNKSDLKLYRVK